MSFDEKQHSDNDEINLTELLRFFWIYKFSLLLFVLLSIPVSIIISSNLTPEYKADTVFEKPQQKSLDRGSSLLSGAARSGLAGLLGGSSIVEPRNSFYSELRSESFLKTVILNNTDFDNQKFQRFCPLPSEQITKFSLRSLLILIGVSEAKTSPSKGQKISMLVKCVNEMLEIDFDTYGSDKTNAYRLSITSPDPIFSANLANQIVEKYFLRHGRVRDQNFQNIKKYLSKVIAEAQMEFVEANELMQRFKIKNTLLMNLNLPLSNSRNTVSGGFEGFTPVVPLSPFAFELDKEIANLSKLEKSLKKSKEVLLVLSGLKASDQEKITAYTSSLEVQDVLSRFFITSISKTDSTSANKSFENQEIKKLVSQELQSLKQQIQVLEDEKVKREDKTKQLMTINNRFQELAIDVSKKQMIFEGLKDQLKEKILQSGLASVMQPVLLTKAVPPFNRHSPNKRLIVILGIVLSLFLGSAFILFRQSLLKRIFSLSQIQNQSRFLNCYEIKYKMLRRMGESSYKTLLSQSFFSKLKQSGKLGCVIDLSQKRQSNSLASEFSKIFAGLLATDNSKIVCLDTSPRKKAFPSSSSQNLASDNSNLSVQGILSKNILSVYDTDNIISSGEFKKIKSKYSEHGKIICALGAEIDDLTKFKFIEQCDFYILIGRSCQFDDFTYKKFSNNDLGKETKCLGFFLID